MNKKGPNDLEEVIDKLKKKNKKLKRIISGYYFDGKKSRILYEKKR